MVHILLENLTKRFGSTVAVDQLSLSIPAGSLFFLLGPSGCGKTTLLRMIAGFTMPTSGRALFGDQDLTFVPPNRRDIGMVFQSYALWPHMTVAENVAFGLDVRKIRGAARAERIAWALSLVQMDKLADRKPNQLSGGQQQRVALARALAIKPRCLLLDEPLSNLDAKLRLEMRAELRKIVKTAQITTIYVTHDQKEALSMADGVAVMRGGRLVQAGPPAELYRRPNSRFVADFVGESNFLPATVEGVEQDHLRLRTPVGTLVAPKGGAWTPGQKVWAAFRPEAIVVSPVASKEANVVGGRLVRSTYLGEMAEHVVELANAQQIKAFELNPTPAGGPAEGMCTVRIPPESVMVVPEDS